MRVAKLSTLRNVLILLIGSADHITGLAGATLTITASKDGGAFASITPTVTDLGNGWYNLALTTTHTNTAGDLALHITATSADPQDVLVQVVAYDMTDAVRLGLTALPNAAAGGAAGLPLGDASGRVDIGKWLGAAVTLTAGVPDVNMKTITAGVIAAASFAANALDAVWSTTTRTLSAFGFSVTASTVSDKTGYALTAAYDPAKTAAQAGDAMALTSGERTTLTASIWNALTSGITTANSIGKLIVDNLNATISSVKALLPAALVGGKMDSSVSALANSTITALSIAPGAFDSAAFTTAAEQAFADRLLARNIAGGSDGGVTVFSMLAAMGMDFSVVAGVLTVKSPIDGVTTVYTRTLSRTAGLDAITGSA